jgi:6-phosphogluconolactonase
VTDPAQVSFTPDGGTLIVTEKATNQIDTYVVSKLALTSGPQVQDSPGATPFGFAFGRRNQVFVSEAFAGAPDASALSAFTVGKLGALQVISPSVGTGQTAACWVVVSNDGRFAFVTNTGSSTISSYSIAFDGTLQLLESVAGTGSGLEFPVVSGPKWTLSRVAQHSGVTAARNRLPSAIGNWIENLFCPISISSLKTQ